MAKVALRMSAHDKPKAFGTLFGVIFALILTNQNVATLMFLIRRNTMFLDSAGAQLWIVAPGTQRLQGGAMLPSGALLQARVTRGVAWAEPIVWGMATIKLPNGGAQPITLIGTRLPDLRGGPWNVVAGTPRALSSPDAMIFEDSEREKLGGLNLGDTREVNQQRVSIVGFTWGLLPFGPSLAFTEYDTGRRMLEVPSDRLHYVLVGTTPEANIKTVQRELQDRAPEAQVLTTAELRASTIRYVMLDEGVGLMVGSSTAIGLLVGFAIVSLTMFTSVLENLREFGTLKAIGATTLDLAKLLFVQSILFATVGSIAGVALLCAIVWLGRSARYNLVLDPLLVAGTVVAIFVLCVLASSLAVARLRKLEPAMVFR